MINVLDEREQIKPVFKTNYVTAVFACDDNYVAQTAVMIRSIVETSSSQANYDIIILSTGLSDVNLANVSVIAEKSQNISIRFYNISKLVCDIEFFTDNVYTPTKYSKEMYFRLFIPHLMPEYSQAIYFDGDMTAVEDIYPLSEIDLGADYVAATRDYSGIAACYDPSSDRKSYRQSLGLAKLDEYFISSLVIFNVPLFNKKFLLQDIKRIISSRYWRQHDQDILNVLCKDKVKIIDPKWSFFEELNYSMRFLPEALQQELLEAYKHPAVLHYAAERKAWLDKNSDFIKYFWMNAVKTNYFDVFNGLLDGSDTSFRYYILHTVLNKKIDYYFTYDDLVLISTPYYIGRLGTLKVCIELLTLKNHELHVEGFYETIDEFGKLKLYILQREERISIYNSDYYRGYGYGSKTKKIRDFNFTINIRYDEAIEFVFSYDDIHFIKPRYVSVEQFAPLNETKESFYCTEGAIITKQNGRSLKIEKASRTKLLRHTKLLCDQIKKRGDKRSKRLVALRKVYTWLIPFFKNKRIWLISGYKDKIDESLLSFIQYIKERKEVTPIIVLSDNFNDKAIRRRLKNFITIKAKSILHKLLFLYADCVIAQKYDLLFFLPCLNRTEDVRDMIANKKFVIWCNNGEFLKYVKPWYNVEKFVVDNDADYKEIVEGNNGYTRQNVMRLKDQTEDFETIFQSLRGEQA